MKPTYSENNAVIIKDKRFGEERALYGSENVALVNCRFEGEEDGESALKECGAVKAEDCYFDLRYPLWHDKKVVLDGCELTENCRAALWYSDNIHIADSKLHGIKALRECKNARIINSDIVSPEFGWSTDGFETENCSAVSEYFAMRARNISMRRLNFKGKYSFQYIENAVFERCEFDTKDAFWHGKNIVVKDSVVKGEYLAWYSRNLTFINCEIIGTQPLCYCKNLRLIDCTMTNTDLAFERSDVRATIRSRVDSIKNPYSGAIILPEVGEIIRDDKKAKGKILLDPSMKKVSASKS